MILGVYHPLPWMQIFLFREDRTKYILCLDFHFLLVLAMLGVCVKVPAFSVHNTDDCVVVVCQAEDEQVVCDGGNSS